MIAIAHCPDPVRTSDAIVANPDPSSGLDRRLPKTVRLVQVGSLSSLAGTRKSVRLWAGARWRARLMPTAIADTFANIHQSLAIASKVASGPSASAFCGTACSRARHSTALRLLLLDMRYKKHPDGDLPPGPSGGPRGHATRSGRPWLDPDALLIDLGLDEPCQVSQ